MLSIIGSFSPMSRGSVQRNEKKETTPHRRDRPRFIRSFGSMDGSRPIIVIGSEVRCGSAVPLAPRSIRPASVACDPPSIVGMARGLPWPHGGIGGYAVRI